MLKKIICTVCPKGCNMIAEYDGKTVTSVNGNSCKRGEIYAESECINPKRTLTTTVLTDKGKVISVKTKEAIPKKLLMECMEILNNIIVKTPVSVGDVVASDILGTGIDVVSTSKLK